MKHPMRFVFLIGGCMAAVLFLAGCKHSGARADSDIVAGAPSVMYQIRSVQTSWRWVDLDEADADAAEDEVAENWELAAPPEMLEDCQPQVDACSCAGVYQATAAVIFVPEERLKIRWLIQTGSAGNYADGMLEETTDGWVWAGASEGKSQQCEVLDMQWDQFRRLLSLTMRCDWESDDGLCKGSDRFNLQFPTQKATSAPEPEELPWTEQVDGETFRFGDDFSHVPIPGYYVPEDADADGEAAE